MKSTNSPERINKLPATLGSSNNISTVLNKNLLGVLGEFCDYATQLKLLGLNRKLREVIKGGEIFDDFLLKRYHLVLDDSEKIHEIFSWEYKVNAYFIEFAEKLRKKHTSSQVEDYLTEVMKIILKHLTEKGYVELQCFDLEKNHFELGDNPLTIKNFCGALKNNKTVTCLHFKYDDLGKNHDEGMKMLMETIKDNTTITKLNVWCSDLGKYPERMKMLIEGLKGDKKITTLDLMGNSLGEYPESESMKILSEGLKDNKTITTLELGGNELGQNPRTLKILIHGLRSNMNVTTVDLEGNYIGEDIEKGLMSVGEYLNINFKF